jgi:predicted AAA+ superfamily ATPase
MSSHLTISRLLNLQDLVDKKSHFLLRPRQTGKSFLIAHSVKGARVYDLLDSAVYLGLSQRPQRLAEELTAKDRIVVIDEIQRLPILLNEVHRLIEQRGTRFLLTGSSARKLRQGGVNLLGGRARERNISIPSQAESLEHISMWTGSLPEGAYRRSISRTIPRLTSRPMPARTFSKKSWRKGRPETFLPSVGSSKWRPTATPPSSISPIWRQMPRFPVPPYFEILKDTLVLHELPAWRETKKRKPLASSKYYFFDIGVTAAIQDRRYRRGTPEYGEAVETYLLHELKSYTDYVSGESLAFWRAKSGFEVDFILGDHTAIELKASENVAPNDLKSLKALAEEKKLKRYLCVSLEARRRQISEITVLPLQEFLKNLWDEAYS